MTGRTTMCYVCTDEIKPEHDDTPLAGPHGADELAICIECFIGVHPNGARARQRIRDLGDAWRWQAHTTHTKSILGQAGQHELDVHYATKRDLLRSLATALGFEEIDRIRRGYESKRVALGTMTRGFYAQTQFLSIETTLVKKGLLESTDSNK